MEIFAVEETRRQASQIPICPATGRHASSRDPSSWSTFQNACDRAQRDGLAGVGFEISCFDPFLGIDLDRCRNPATGEIATWAMEIVALEETYTEISPSETGLRLIARGTLSHAEICNAANVEVYSDRRFLTITGNRLPSAPNYIAEAPRTLELLRARIAQFKPPRKPAAERAQTTPRRDFVFSDEAAERDFLERALACVPADDRDVWLRVGMALHHRNAPWSRELWDAWSCKSHKFNADDQDRTWSSLDGNAETPVTLASIVALARQHGFEGSTRDPVRDFAGIDAKLVTEILGPSAFEGFRMNERVDAIGEPVDFFTRVIVPTFPDSILPESIARFVASNAKNVGCCASGLAMCVLATCSAAIGHQSSLKLKRHGSFFASPRLWLLLVGDPSSKKSPMLNAATRPLRRIDNAAHDDFAAIGGDTARIQELFGCTPDQAKPPRLIVGDSTIEALGQILSRQNRGTLVFRDEISGWIGSMEKYAGGGRGSAADRAFWLQSFDGGPYYVDRVGRGELRIKNLSLSIIGGIQPDRLAELHGLTSDGLLQRFLPVMLSESRFGTDAPMDESAQQYDALIRQLRYLPPVHLALTEPAIDTMADLHRWLHDLEHETRGVYQGFQGFVGKLSGLSGSLALNLHLIKDPVRNAVLPVEKATIEDVALLIKKFVVPNGFELYRTAEATTDGDRLARIASWILTSGAERITASDLTRNVAIFRGEKVADVGDIVSPLVAGAWLIPETAGRWTTAWRVNPKIHVLFAERAAEEERRKAALAEVMNAKRQTK